MFPKSVCHWCHVMARESFENQDIAKILNAGFVPVKVDREERPEVDLVYMSVCQAMTGQGGWPLTIIMTPDKKPFFAGTYFPSQSGYGMTGLREILTGVREMWKTDRKKLLQISDEILSVVKNRENEPGSAQVTWKLVKQGFMELNASFDKNYGGFGRAPKFPSPHNLLFLLMYYAEKNEPKALFMAEKTLTSMARGGIRDQIGGGFSRYSTDSYWLVPHFEKMLYDNALLTLAYLEGFRLTNSAYYRKTAESILTYVARELTSVEGGFYCGQDADSQGEEGRYYVFTRAEISQVLVTEEEQHDFCQWFNITERGNFEEKNIPNLIHNQHYANSSPYMDALCQKVYEYRSKRMLLHRDDKQLTSWISMMILAYARAGLLLSNAAYAKAACRAQKFVERNLVDRNDRLLVRYRDGESAFYGNLDDYAYYSLALTALYEATLDINYLELAVRRAGQMVDFFWDDRNGGFYFYGNDAPKLIERPKELYDGAVPSGNSAAAHVLLALADLTAEQQWRELARRQLSFLASGAADHPSAHCFSLMAFIKALSAEKELVCVSADSQAPRELYDYMKDLKDSRISVLFKCPDNQDRLARIAPFTSAYEIPGKGLSYYLCENHTCGVPFSSLSGKMESI